METVESLLLRLKRIRKEERQIRSDGENRVGPVATRLYEVFNFENDELRVDRSPRLELGRARREAATLSTEINLSMIRKEYNSQELGSLVTAMRAAVNSSACLQDPALASLSGILLPSLEGAYIDASLAEAPRARRKREEVEQIQIAILHRLLKEDAGFAQRMRNLAALAEHEFHTVAPISQPELPTGEDELVALAHRLGEIFDEECLRTRPSVNAFAHQNDSADHGPQLQEWSLRGACRRLTREFFGIADTFDAGSASERPSHISARRLVPEAS